MSLGLLVDKNSINYSIGLATQALRDSLDALMKYQEHFAGQTADELATQYGFTAQEGLIIKSALADGSQLKRIYRGEEALPTAHDFRAFLEQFAGLTPTKATAI